MWRILGEPGKDLCNKNLGVTRRDVLRVGGSGMLGLSLGSMLELQARAEQAPVPDPWRCLEEVQRKAIGRQRPWAIRSSGVILHFAETGVNGRAEGVDASVDASERKSHRPA